MSKRVKQQYDYKCVGAVEDPSDSGHTTCPILYAEHSCQRQGCPSPHGNHSSFEQKICFCRPFASQSVPPKLYCSFGTCAPYTSLSDTSIAKLLLSICPLSEYKKMTRYIVEIESFERNDHIEMARKFREDYIGRHVLVKHNNHSSIAVIDNVQDAITKTNQYALIRFYDREFNSITLVPWSHLLEASVAPVSHISDADDDEKWQGHYYYPHGFNGNRVPSPSPLPSGGKTGVLGIYLSDSTSQESDIDDICNSSPSLCRVDDSFQSLSLHQSFALNNSHMDDAVSPMQQLIPKRYKVEVLDGQTSLHRSCFVNIRFIQYYDNCDSLDDGGDVVKREREEAGGHMEHMDDPLESICVYKHINFIKLASVNNMKRNSLALNSHHIPFRCQSASCKTTTKYENLYTQRAPCHDEYRCPVYCEQCLLLMVQESAMKQYWKIINIDEYIPLIFKPKQSTDISNKTIAKPMIYFPSPSSFIPSEELQRQRKSTRIQVLEYSTQSLTFKCHGSHCTAPSSTNATFNLKFQFCTNKTCRTPFSSSCVHREGHSSLVDGDQGLRDRVMFLFCATCFNPRRISKFNEHEWKKVNQGDFNNILKLLSMNNREGIIYEPVKPHKVALFTFAPSVFAWTPPEDILVQYFRKLQRKLLEADLLKPTNITIVDSESDTSDNDDNDDSECDKEVDNTNDKHALYSKPKAPPIENKDRMLLTKDLPYRCYGSNCVVRFTGGGNLRLKLEYCKRKFCKDKFKHSNKEGCSHRNWNHKFKNKRRYMKLLCGSCFEIEKRQFYILARSYDMHWDPNEWLVLYSQKEWEHIRNLWSNNCITDDADSGDDNSEDHFESSDGDNTELKHNNASVVIKSENNNCRSEKRFQSPRLSIFMENYYFPLTPFMSFRCCGSQCVAGGGVGGCFHLLLQYCTIKNCSTPCQASCVHRGIGDKFDGSSLSSRIIRLFCTTCFQAHFRSNKMFYENTYKIEKKICYYEDKNKDDIPLHASDWKTVVKSEWERVVELWQDAWKETGDDVRHTARKLCYQPWIRILKNDSKSDSSNDGPLKKTVSGNVCTATCRPSQKRKVFDIESQDNSGLSSHVYLNSSSCTDTNCISLPIEEKQCMTSLALESFSSTAPRIPIPIRDSVTVDSGGEDVLQRKKNRPLHKPPKIQKRFLPFEEARAYTRSLNLNISSHRQWKKWSKNNRPKNIPCCPWTTYGEEFRGIHDWTRCLP